MSATSTGKRLTRSFIVLSGVGTSVFRDEEAAPPPFFMRN